MPFQGNNRHNKGGNKKRRWKNNRNNNNNFQRNTAQQSRVVRDLGNKTGHGFQVYENLEEMERYFTTDPEQRPQLEPPMFNKGKPTQRDLRRSRGT